MSLIWIYVVLVVSVFLHELGHAIAARTGGYLVTSFGIGNGRPLAVFRLPRSGTLLYLCRFRLHFSGVTWVVFLKGLPTRVSDLSVACGGALLNALIACGAALALTSFELRAVPFLSVWVPTVVVLLVNSVLALSFFMPRRTSTAEQGILISDGLQALSVLFPSRLRGKIAGSAAAPLRTLRQKRAFWKSIGDSTMLCVALIRAAEAYRELGDEDTARACWKELSVLEVMPAAAPYQRAWDLLLGVRFNGVADPASALDEAERLFQTIGNRTGVLIVARERQMRFELQTNQINPNTRLASLQTEALANGDAPLALSFLADRIELQGTSLLQGGPKGKELVAGLAILERLASQYDAARVEIESSVLDVRVYAKIASVRAALKDDGGAAVAYERALSAARRVYAALAFDPDIQSRFAARQATLITTAVECCRRLGREADAARYTRLFG